MNDDRLSPREHDEMRDIVLAGTQRIKPAGRYRAQIAAGVVALVLVGGVTGGAVTTAVILGAGPDTGPVTSPSPSPSDGPAPTPAPTPSAPPVSAEGTTPFGGECANALSDEEVGALSGIAMQRSDYRWRTGANDLLGGIDCVWVSSEAYLAATVHLYAYPQDLVSQSLLDLAAPGCVDPTGDLSRVSCMTYGDVDGTFLMISAEGDGTQITKAGIDALFDGAATRLEEYPPGTPVTRQPDWWAQPDCDALVSRTDPALYGYERVARLEGQSGRPLSDVSSIPLFLDAVSYCDLHFTSGSGETSSGEVVSVAVVPGGAISFHTAVEAEHSEPVDVPGAEAAVIVPGLDRYEGSPAVIVATDGVNILMVTPDMIRDTADAASLAGSLLALMSP